MLGGFDMVYEYGNWMLYERNIKMKNGDVYTVYFFSKSIPKFGTPCDLPPDKKVVIDRKFGYPHLMRK
jgi:hypothetical protein